MTGNATKAKAAIALYVATDLSCWETDAPHIWARDVGIHGTCFRRLDAPFYAWLRRQVERARSACDVGRLAAEAFETIRSRFNAVHAWALEHLGEAVLLAAGNAPVHPYEPPTMEALETVRLGITDAGPGRRR